MKVTEELLKRKINICSTIRKNRDVPNCLKTNALNDMPMAFRIKRNISIQIWNSSKKLITIISTIHSASMVECISKRTQKKSMNPICAREYNKFMKGFDRADQYLTYYSILLKCKNGQRRRSCI